LWILGPRRDLLFFVLTPLLIIPLVFAIKPHVDLVIFGTMVQGFGGFGHHLPGFIRAYADRELFQQYKVRFVLVPILLALTCGFFAYLDLNAVTLAVVVWGAWHGAMQVNGFLRIYDSKVKSFARTTAWLDWLMCLFWFAFVILHSPVKLFALLSHFYVSGGPLIPPAAFSLFIRAWDGATILLTVLFLTNAVIQRRKGVPPSPVKLLTMAVSFSFWWYCMVSVNNLMLGVILFEIFHDVQYNVLIWLFQRHRVTGGNAGNVEKLLFGFGFGRMALYLILIGAYGYIGVAASYVDINMPEKIVQNDVPMLWMLRVLAVSAILHFYYDGFIWRVRNQSVRKGLGLKEEKRAQAFIPVASVKHALKWGIFALPVLGFGFFQYRGWAPTSKSMFQNLSEAVPKSWMGHYMAASQYKAEGDFVSAARQFQQTIELEPSKLEVRTNLAFMLLKAGKWNEANEQYRIALSQDPENPDLAFGLAASLMHLYKLPEAEPYLVATLRARPRHADALEYLGMVRDVSGNLEEAVSYYLQALEADTVNAVARLKNLNSALQRLQEQKP